MLTGTREIRRSDMLRMRYLKMDKDFCSTCQRVVPETTEHDFKAHLSTKEQADELASWKLALKKTGEHHR